MQIFRGVDWLMLGSAVLISLAGLVTMYGFGGTSTFASHQVIWIVIGVILFFVLGSVDFHFLRQTRVVVAIYVVAVVFLALLFVVGSAFNGARGWFNAGWFAIQPVDLAEFAIIVVLAKYFSRRHVEIAHFRHLVASGFYTLVIFVLVFLQPDFGEAIIVAGVWMGMVLLAGIPLRQLLVLGALGLAAISFLWLFAFHTYQKERIVAFLHPLENVSSIGYNAFQSTVAVGSGGVFGKGIGYGTQSRLQFLPEHQTDFIFASFAEEWGLIGTLILLGVFATLIYRLVANAEQGATNFETLFALGVATLFVTHAAIHAGMNVGLLPVTGVPFPFMSYGGSQIVTGYSMLGMVNAMRRYGRTVHEDARHEMIGVG